MTEHTDDAASAGKKKPEYRIEISMYSGNIIEFTATKFEMDRKPDGSVLSMEWELAPCMMEPGVFRPLLGLIDPRRIEAVVMMELRQ